MKRFTRWLGNRLYWTGAWLGFLCAKFRLGFKTFYQPDRPGNWID